MGHLSISPAKGADTFTPLTKSYDRIGKDGAIPQVNYLMGSQYNIKIDGEISTTSVGNITNDTLKAVSGKLEIVGESVDGTEVEKQGAYVTFTYFYPGLKIVGESEIQDADVGSGPVPVQRISHVFEDLATTDRFIVDLQGGDGNAQLVIREKVSGTTTDLATVELPTGVINVKWELDFQEDGITKFYYKIPSGSRTRIFNGTLKAKLGESKAVVKLVLDQQATKTVKSDFLLFYYPNINLGYDVDISTRLSGRIKIFDTDNEVLESDWIEVFSGDHDFTGERVIENGFIRIWFKTTPSMKVYGWSIGSASWELASTVIPVSTQSDLATSLQDIVFRAYNDSFIKINVKYGIVDHLIDMKRGQPYVRIVSNSRELRIDNTTRRFVLSTDVSADIPDFNQNNSDNANRGNPLNLSPTNNPFTFTDDNDINTGLDRLDDSWYAWYDETDSNNMVGWMAVAKQPTGLVVTATSATELEKATWTWDADGIFTMGILESDPTTKIGGIPKPFSIGIIDEYVKWRANESIYGFNQRGIIRRKR